MIPGKSAEVDYTDSPGPTNELPGTASTGPVVSCGSSEDRHTLQLSVAPSGKIRATFEAFSEHLTSDFANGLVGLCRDAASLTKAAGLGRVKRDTSLAASLPSQQQSERYRRRIEVRHLARLIDRWLRKHQPDYPSTKDADHAAAEFFGQPLGSIQILTKHHRRRRKVRYDRLADRRIVRLYSEGWSFGRIGKELGVSAKTVAKRAKQAMSEMSNVTDSATSQNGIGRIREVRNGR